MPLGETFKRPVRGRFGLLCAGLAWIGLAGCSEPFPTGSPAAVDSESGEPLGNLISLCYGTEMNDEEEIKARAQELCKGRLVFVGQTMFFNDCPLLQNTRVTYQCRPLPPGGAGGRRSVPPS
ncbi:MAG: hypothetical protein QNJ30_06240 [Kiloniellales bacterium]|nr:hypothetical protein [Kiloniellales bacterium]